MGRGLTAATGRLEAEVFAVAGGVLADEGGHWPPWAMRFWASARIEPMRREPELAAGTGDDAEAARVVAAFGDFDVGGGPRGGEDAWSGVVVEIFGECGGCPVPGGAGEAAGGFSQRAFGTKGNRRSFDYALRFATLTQRFAQDDKSYFWSWSWALLQWGGSVDGRKTGRGSRMLNGGESDGAGAGEVRPAAVIGELAGASAWHHFRGCFCGSRRDSVRRDSRRR